MLPLSEFSILWRRVFAFIIDVSSITAVLIFVDLSNKYKTQISIDISTASALLLLSIIYIIFSSAILTVFCQRCKEILGDCLHTNSPNIKDRFKKLVRLTQLIFTFTVGILVAIYLLNIITTPLADQNMLTKSNILFDIIVFILIYLPMLESSKYNGSLGMLLMRIKVLDREEKRLTYWQALVRLISFITDLVSFLHPSHIAYNIMKCFYYFSPYKKNDTQKEYYITLR